jgi:hypothetical protein
MTVFEFIGQFFFHNDVFKPQEVSSKHVIRVFLENGLGQNRGAKKIPKTVLKTRLKTKETTYILIL